MTKVGQTGRLTLCAFAACLWLALAAEARAQEAPPPPSDTVPVGTAPSDGEQAPPGGGDDSTTADPTPPGDSVPGTGSGEPNVPPVSEQPPQDQASPEQPAPPAAEQPPPTPPATEQPPPTAEPPVQQPPPGPPAPGDQVTWPGPAAPPVDPPVLEPPLVLEVPVIEVPLSDPVVGPEPSDPIEVSADVAKVGSLGESIVTIHQHRSPPSVPSFFRTPPGATFPPVGPAHRLDVQRQSRSQAGDDGPSANTTGTNAPLLPPLPARERVPSMLLSSGAGTSGGSAGGFGWVLAGLVALIFVGAQRLGGLVPLNVAPLRCTAFALCLERPD